MNREVGKVYYPSNLLTKSSTKTLKGEKFGWDTHILYLSPHKQNRHGKNLCPKATAGCSAACLYTAGRGRFSTVQRARMNKTELFLTQRKWFLEKLYKELTNIDSKDAGAEGIVPLLGAKRQCVRLNGTSDIPWENIKWKGMNLFEHFHNLQFYDYTKDPKRVLNNKYANYHLTFSRSEENNNTCLDILNTGNNVAFVFAKDTYKDVINKGKFLKWDVIDGDESDLRFLDRNGVIVALKSKGDGNKDSSGFIIR